MLVPFKGPRGQAGMKIMASSDDNQVDFVIFDYAV
jgi:hypothetical protein